MIFYLSSRSTDNTCFLSLLICILAVSKYSLFYVAKSVNIHSGYRLYYLTNVLWIVDYLAHVDKTFTTLEQSIHEYIKVLILH